MPLIIIAGQELHAQIQTFKAEQVPQAGGLYRSEDLCKFQQKMSKLSIIEIEIVESNYGYSVRYASGLQNFGLLRASRGAKDPSIEAAIAFCEQWVSQDPTRRYATYSPYS